jgi:putative zinc finger/helix-turn-helix YgiT family protein
MPTRCINCDEADLDVGRVELTGQVRGESYTVALDGLVCPKCGYTTIEGTAMPEFGRLLADQYRAAHGLLTSTDIRNRRNQMQMSQLEFANFLGVGVASVKRWELGKIQEKRMDDLIRSKTQANAMNVGMQLPPVRVLNLLDSFDIGVSAGHYFGFALGSSTFVNAFVKQADQTYIDKVQHEFCRAGCKQTGMKDVFVFDIPNQQTLSPYFAAMFNEHHNINRRKNRHRD